MEPKAAVPTQIVNQFEALSLSSQDTTLKDPSTGIQYIAEDLVLFTKQVIGSGAYGTVFKGELSGQLCALKVLRPLADEIQTSLPIAGQAKQDSIDRFQRECEYLEDFKHPNVVRHLATRIHPNNSHLVLALELMDCNLRQFFLSAPGKDLSFETQRSLCRDIASALVYLHSRDVIHRDLCSDNILLINWKGENPVAKVCDFGLSKINTKRKTAISVAPFARGGYLPPEARRSGSHDCSFDIFAFGAVMVQIVRCMPTIDTEQQRKSQLRAIEEARHPLKDIIKKCLNTNPKKRPSATDLEIKLS